MSNQFPIISETADIWDDLLLNKGIDVFFSTLERPSTSGDISRKLKVSRAKVNYLIDVLLSKKLIYLQNEINTGSTVEKYYAASTDSFEILASHNTSNADKLKAMIYILDIMRENLIKGLNEANIQKKNHAHLSMVHVKIPPEIAKNYMQKLIEIESEFDSEISENHDDGDWYTMVTSVFKGPSFS